jgi:hypothetical protein
MTPEERVLAVFDRVRRSDPSVSDLYAIDATLRARNELHEGRAAIGRFYEERFRTSPVQPQVDDLFVSLPVVVAVLSVTMGNGDVRRFADVFEVDDEGIRSLRVCQLAS